MGYGVSTGAAGGMGLRGTAAHRRRGCRPRACWYSSTAIRKYMGAHGTSDRDATSRCWPSASKSYAAPPRYLRFQRHGRRHQLSSRASSAREGHPHRPASRLRLLQHVADRAVEPYPQGTLHERRHRSYNRTDGHRADMSFEQYGGYAKLGIRAFESMDAVGRREPDALQRIESGRGDGAAHRQRLAHHARTGLRRPGQPLRPHVGRPEPLLQLGGGHKIDDGYAAGSEPLDYRFNSRDRMLGVSWYQSAQLFAGNRLTVGFDYFHFGGESWNRFLDGHEETQVDKTQDEVAGYVDFRQSLGTWLTLDGAPRRPPLPCGHRVGAAGGCLVPPAAQRRDQALGRQRIPLPHDPRTLHVPPREPPTCVPSGCGATNCRSRSGYGRDGSPTASISSISTAKT